MTVPNQYEPWAEYLRVSKKGQSWEQQVEGNANFFKRFGIDSALRFEDTGNQAGRRHRADKRVDFQRLVEAVKANKIQNLLLSSLDRWGTEDETELLNRIKEFRAYGCKVWTADDGRCVTAKDDATILINLIGGLKSKKEQRDRSDRDHKKKVLMATAGQFTGGPVLYGFDLECRSQGKVLWRFVVEGKKKVEVPKDGKVVNYEWQYGVLIKDGKETKVERIPSHDHRTETVHLVHSIRKERLETVAHVFEWYATEAVGTREIANRLNERGISAIHSPLWYPIRINKMLRHPAYAGIASYYKTSTASFYRYQGKDPETGARLVAEAADSKGTYHAYPRDQWVTAPVWDQVAKPDHLEAVEQKVNSTKRNRQPRNKECWLSHVLICGHCGGTMRAKHYTRRSDGGFIPGYCCSAYATYRNDPKLGCHTNGCQHKAVESVLLRWLEEEGPGITALLARVGDPEGLALLERDQENCHSALRGIFDRMKGFIEEALTSEETEFGRALTTSQRQYCDQSGNPIDPEGLPPLESDPELPPQREGGWDIATFYGYLFDVRGKRLRKRLAELQSELDQSVEAFARISNARAMAAADKKLTALGEEIAKIETALEPLADSRIDLLAELRDLDDRHKRATVELKHGTNRQKAEAIRRLVKEIRLFFDHTPTTGKKGESERSRLVRVQIVPETGETAEFSSVSSEGSFELVSWPRNSQPAWPPSR